MVVKFGQLIVVLSAGLVLAGCAGLPNGGPTSSAILEDNYSEDSELVQRRFPDYRIVEVTPDVISQLNVHAPQGFVGTFGQGWATKVSTFGVGDSLNVTVFEATTGGLFGTGDGQSVGTKSVTLPPQQVDPSGYISIPYAGRVKAAGRTPTQVQAAIVGALDGKAIEPQAIVTLDKNGSRFVSVSGEVGQGGRFSLTASGDRILDAVALAGGPKEAAYQIYVRLTRGSRSAVMKLDSLVASPKENVYLSPGDQVFLYRNPQSFTVLGALAKNSNVEFQSKQISLVEALGKASGLIDQRSDASGVFVFRFELGQTLVTIDTENAAELENDREYPVVYHVNLRDARGLFLSQAFQIRDKDVVYVSTAPATDLQKFLQILGTGFGVAGGVAGTVNIVAP